MSEDVQNAGASHASPLQCRLEDYYRQTDKDFQIGDFEAISDGWETEVYSFTLAHGSETERLILRMYPGSNMLGKCAHEYRALAGLHTNGYPVPRVALHETDPARLGKPFLIMEKIDGRSMGTILLNDAARQPELLTRFVQLMVDLHRIDYRAVLGTNEEYEPTRWLARKLASDRAYMQDERGQAWVAPVFDWLDAHQADISPMPPASLHRDFHPWNVLITPDDRAFVIDWASFGGGDYRDDLGWTLMLFASGGFHAFRETLLSEYARLSGHAVEQIEYFEVFNTLWRLFDFTVSLSSGAESLGMRPETVATMRAQGERFGRVYDLLRDRSGLRLPEIEKLLGSL